MTGSIKRDPSRGTWTLVIDVPTSNGRRTQLRRRGFKTRRAAESARTELLSSLQRGTFVRPRRTTVHSYLSSWIDALPSAGRRPSTIDSYRRNVERNVIPSIGGIELQAVSPVDLDNLYASLLARGLSMRSVRYVHAIVGKALADAERKGLVLRNVARLATPPSASAARAPEMRVWTPAELRSFLDHLGDHRHSTLFRLAAMTGLRRAELCGLRWSDVDIDAGTASVRQTITAVNGHPVRSDVKTPRSRRVVSIDASTVAALRQHRRAQTEQRLFMGGGWRDSGLVFAMPTGAGWNPDTISQAFDRLVVTSDVPRIRLHDLRHTHASHLLAAGVNVKVVSERLGHASVAFTLDVYAHVMPGQQADAAEAVAALVDGR